MQEITSENGATRAGSSAQINVRLCPVERSDQPIASNFATVAVAQGIAYLDFGFIEPALLGAIARTENNGQPAPNAVDGQRVTRVAMGVSGLARLHRQIQQVLIGLHDASQAKIK